MRRLILVASVVGLLISGLTVTPSGATLVTDGDPYIANSWGQRFAEGGLGGLFDSMRIEWISGSTFEVPAFRNFSNGSWFQSDQGSATVAVAASPGLVTEYLEFDILFQNTLTSPVKFQFTAYHGTSLVDTAWVAWDGNGTWDISQIDIEPVVAAEPSTLLLLGSGLLGAAIVGGLRRKTS